MGNKGILGGKVVNHVYVHQEALHLALQPVMMFILFLMKGNQKLSVIENTGSLLGPLCNGAFSGFSEGMMRCMGSTSQRINMSDCWVAYNVLRELFLSAF